MKIATIATASLSLSLSLFLAVPTLADDPVSLIGIWEGEEVGVGALDGWDRHDFVLEILEQQGTAFIGVKSYGTPGAYETESIYGSMTPDGRIVVIVDADGAFNGTLVGTDVLDLCYTETGVDASAKCVRLIRQ